MIQAGGLKLLYMFLCSFSFSASMSDVLGCHLASIANPIVSKLSSFDLPEDLAGRCYEVLIREKPIVFPPMTQDQVFWFSNLSSAKMTVLLGFDVDDNILDNVKRRKQSSVYPKEEKTVQNFKEALVRVPLVPDDLQYLLLYPEDAEVFAADVAAEIGRNLNLDFLGQIQLLEHPAGMEVPENGYLPHNWNVSNALLFMLEHELDTKALIWGILQTTEPLPGPEGRAHSSHPQLDHADEVAPPPPPEDANDSLPPPPPPPPQEDEEPPVPMEDQQEMHVPSAWRQLDRRQPSESAQEQRTWPKPDPWKTAALETDSLEQQEFKVEPQVEQEVLVVQEDEKEAPVSSTPASPTSKAKAPSSMDAKAKAAALRERAAKLKARG